MKGSVNILSPSYDRIAEEVVWVLCRLSIFSGAVAQDGRIEQGDMILEVNGVSFENLSNDEAVRTIREVVQKPG